MRADAECEMLADLPVDVENVSVGRELAVITDSCADQHHHHAALGHGLAVELHIPGHIPRDVRRGRFEAQQLFYRLGDEGRVSTSSRRWSGCSANTFPAQPINRVVVSLPAPATTLR